MIRVQIHLSSLLFNPTKPNLSFRYVYTIKPPKPSFITDYLINSLGLSPDRAAKAAQRLAHIRDARRPDSVRHFLKHLGLTDSHIQTLVSWCPILLSADLATTLQPNAAALQAHGFSGPLLVHLVRSNPFVLISDGVLPRLHFWKDFFRNDEKSLLKVFRRNRYLVHYDIAEKIAPNIELLRGYGFSDRDIGIVVMRINGFITRSPEAIKELIERTMELGFSCGSGMFLQGLSVVGMRRGEALEMKMEFFKKLGWSEDESQSAFKKNPKVLSLRVENIQSKLDFLMGEAGLDPSSIAKMPLLLTYSLEKRLRPRFLVLDMLKSHELLKRGCNVNTAMSLSDEEFMDKFVVPFKDVVPQLDEVHLSSY
ncbi:hypothetical protein J5N97_010628 [Dioscorea zingiberensis]|uniref:Uncharacterized protein n=1 Tax=Dioscorea zingiberensis TaxID=325984 RepID=A0A9D5D1J0_9LILI|nr:hypothetical protein J5N97_010628 [Dioscorea zingiberensis]